MPVESISQQQNQRRLYLLYHELRVTQSNYTYVTDTATFARHLDLYGQLRQSTAPGSLQPEVTFDDGHSSNLDIAAPMLQARNMIARFFITVGWTGKKPGYMGWPELQSLHCAGHSIGAHGWSHALLTHCSDHELEHELSGSRLTLEDKLGVAVTTMSLPGGRYNRRVLTACQEAGYTQVYTSVPKSETLPLGTTVGRLNILGDMQPEWLAQLFKPDGTFLSKLGRQYRWKESVKSLLGDSLYAKLWALVNRQEPDPDASQEVSK